MANRSYVSEVAALIDAADRRSSIDKMVPHPLPIGDRAPIRGDQCPDASDRADPLTRWRARKAWSKGLSGETPDAILAQQQRRKSVEPVAVKAGLPVPALLADCVAVNG
jgi:hypothetical protein